MKIALRLIDYISGLQREIDDLEPLPCVFILFFDKNCIRYQWRASCRIVL